MGNERVASLDLTISGFCEELIDLDVSWVSQQETEPAP